MREKRGKKLKVCLTCSSGGHMKQLLKMAPAYAKHDHYFLLFYKESIANFIKEHKTYIVDNPERSPVLFARHALQAARVFFKERPDVVMTTGAGVAVATCYLAKLFGKKVVFIEDWCMVNTPTATGRLLYPIADLTIIQREELRKHYPNAVLGGELF
jgi:beta-1,4-N-acetylglucosaminyltransferase